MYLPDVLRNVILQDCREEDLIALEEDDRERIRLITDKRVIAKYNMALNILRGLELANDRKFNDLVESKATAWRKTQGKSYIKQLLTS